MSDDWELQLVQNYVYPWATFGKEPMATWLKARDDELINHFPEEEINVVVVGGETNGYWRIMGTNIAKPSPSMIGGEALRPPFAGAGTWCIVQ